MVRFVQCWVSGIGFLIFALKIDKTCLFLAARSTNALIVTGGSNTGTMKLVGDAVREGQFMVMDGDRMTRGLRLLGLCSWGYTKNFETLVNPDPDDYHHAKYNSAVNAGQAGPGSGNVPLNGDHTHFLLIDDGSR